MTTYADEVAVADNVRQGAKTTLTDAAHKAADIAYYKELVRLEVKYDVNNGALAALERLGVRHEAVGTAVDHSGKKSHFA